MIVRMAATALCIATSITFSASGQAPESGAPYALITKTGPRAADVGGRSMADGADIIQWPYVNAPNQHWIFEDAGGGAYRIKAQHSNKYMTASGPGNGADITQQPRSGNNLQQWQIRPQQGGYVAIINQGSSKALEVFGGDPVDGLTLTQWDLTGDANQLWRLFPARIMTLADAGPVTNRANLGRTVNSECSELGPVPTIDGSALYLTVTSCARNIEGAAGKGGDIWYTTRTDGGGWAPVTSLGSPLNNHLSNAVSGVSADGNTLLLMGTYLPDGRYSLYGLSMTHRTDTGWSAPEPLTIADYYDAGSPATYALLPTGKGIILSMQRADSYGANDLYVSFRQDDGTWSAPRNLGVGVNSPGYEFGAYLAADNRTLYFASWGWHGHGQSDIFVSKRLDDTWVNWSEARNLGPGVNTDGFEGSFVISGDGSRAYITSSAGSIGGSDIFTVDLPEALRPDPVVIVTGTVVNANTDQPIAAGIAYERLRDGEDIGVAFTTTQRGFALALPQGEQYGVFATADGYYAITEHLDLTSLDQSRRVELKLRMVPIEVGSTVRLNNVFFDVGTANLRAESHAELDRLVTMLRTNPGIRIEVAGHTDATGADDANLTLSQRRSASVADYLIAQGIVASRLQSRGYGETQPVASNETEDGRQLNRRVEFRILQR